MSSRRLKYLIKSKSFSFVKDLKDKSNKVKSYYWNNQKIFYRTSSSDMALIYQILLKSKYQAEYLFPSILSPKVIFDIGGNIGITSVYLASIFPEALIYTFEPLEDNFMILQKNIQPYNNIKAFNFGLGSKNGNFKVYQSDDLENFGGVSFYPDPTGNKTEPYISCEIKNINDVIKELNIDSIDLIKIDTEGAEHDILTSLEKNFLRATSWITGELHGKQDFELLNYLHDLGFSIGVKKLIDSRLFMFHGGRSEIISQLTRREIKALK